MEQKLADELLRKDSKTCYETTTLLWDGLEYLGFYGAKAACPITGGLVGG